MENESEKAGDMMEAGIPIKKTFCSVELVLLVPSI